MLGCGFNNRRVVLGATAVLLLVAITGGFSRRLPRVVERLVRGAIDQSDGLHVARTFAPSINRGGLSNGRPKFLRLRADSAVSPGCHHLALHALADEHWALHGATSLPPVGSLSLQTWSVRLQI